MILFELTLLPLWQILSAAGGYPLGDLVTEDGPVILAALSRAALDALERFTARQDISGWSCGAAFNAMVALVFWGKAADSGSAVRSAVNGAKIRRI